MRSITESSLALNKPSDKLGSIRFFGGTSPVAMDFTCAFLNCERLFSSGQPSGSAGNSTAINDRIDALAKTLRAATGTGSPDVMGLCEVGDEAVGRRLAEAVAPDAYELIWSGEQPTGKTGLVVLYARDRFEHRPPEFDRTKSKATRDKWTAVLLTPREGVRAPFWFAVHHRTADIGGPSGEEYRRESWRSFSQFVHERAKIETDAMIIVGDFNCEPGDPPLARSVCPNLEPTRERALVMGKTRDATRLYNPMWRLLGEPDPLEVTLVKGYQRSRPVGTYCQRGRTTGWRMVDQLMVTPSLLAGAYLRFRESTLSISEPISSCTDHCAVSASFQLLGEF